MRKRMSIKRIRLVLISFVLFAIQAQASEQTLAKIECKYSGNVNTCKYSKLPFKYTFTNMPYALCSTALCKLNSNKTEATCTCKIYGLEKSEGVWKSYSVGTKPYEESKPTYAGGKLVTVTSNYSLADQNSLSDLPTYKPITCKFTEATPWAECLGTICKVDYQSNNGKSTLVVKCACPVIFSKEFLINYSGKSCTTTNDEVWSGASATSSYDNLQAIDILYTNLQKGKT